jgi:DNA replication protein DnaC
MSAELIVCDHLRSLKLSGSLYEFNRQKQEPASLSLSFDERLAMILGAQVDMRINRRIQRRTKEAELKISSRPEEIDYNHHRSITKAQMQEILSMSFVRRAHNVIITGPTGVGKTFIACAIGTAGISADLAVRYYRLSSLFDEIAIARGDGTYKRLIAYLRSRDLLIIDDFSLAPIPSRGSRELLDLLDARIGQSSTIIATQMPVAALYQTFEDATVADAILDRLVHDSIRLEMKGESMRKIRAQHPEMRDEP